MGQSQQRQLDLWEETTAAIDEYERLEWEKITPGRFRLSIYWVQMLVCYVECGFRVVFHGLAAACAWPFYELAVRSLRQTGQWSSERNADENFANAMKAGGIDAAYHWPILPFTQLQHHSFWFLMYFNYLPPLITHNISHPSMPLFTDGADISIYRPSRPTTSPETCCDCSCPCSGCCSNPCECSVCDKQCNDACENCCILFLGMGLRYLRSSFVALSGYHALQCGTLCGPCVRPCCYDPCVGSDTEKGLCKLCEVDEIRNRRWLREAHESKMVRTKAFFDAHPKLLRPEEDMTKLVTGPPDPRIAGLMKPLLEEPAPHQAPQQEKGMVGRLFG